VHRAHDGAVSSNQPDPHIRDHLANERTYLAYLRTSLSLLSLGISINRFSLYLLEKNVLPTETTMRATLLGAEQLGIGMVVVGFILLVYGIMRFTGMSKEIDAQTYRPNIRAMWVLSAIILIAALGGVALLFTR
jgi:putative membrane protein